MKEKLDNKLNSLNKESKILLEYLSSFSEEELNKQPQEGSWSALQVVNHLILSEKGSIAYCKKKLSFNPKLKTAGIMSSIGSKIVQLYLWSPIKVKAPKGVGAEVLPKNDTLEQVEMKWKKVRDEMKTFFDELPEEYVNKEVYKHPFGGRLSIVGMMAFFRSHVGRHKKQIKRALS